MPFAAILSFLGSGVGKIVMYVIAGLLATGILTGVYLTWKHNVEEAQQLRFEKAQLEEVVKDQTKTIENQKAIVVIQTDTTKKLDDKTEAIDKDRERVDDAINAETDDRPVGPVLQNLFKNLGAK
jgi:Na+-translocating ferredoxin:NAD+ oxidoreductase RnfG subunit